MGLFCFVFMMLVSSTAHATWVYIPPAYSGVQVGGWDGTLMKWDQFSLVGSSDYYLMSGAVPSFSPLATVPNFPALTPEMLVKAQVTNQNINPYSSAGSLPLGWFQASFDPLVASKLFGFAFLLVAISAAVGDGIGVMFRLLK